MTKKDYNDEDGVWRTIGGRKVFIRKGQNLADAMIESGKFKTKGKMRENYRKEKAKDEKEEEELTQEAKKQDKENGYDIKHHDKWVEKAMDNVDKYSNYANTKKEVERKQYDREDEEFEKGLEKYDDESNKDFLRRGKLQDDYDSGKIGEREYNRRSGELDRKKMERERQEEGSLREKYRNEKEKKELDQARRKQDEEEEKNESNDNELHALYAQYLHDKQGKSWERITSLEQNEKDFNKSMKDWSKTKERQDYEKESDNETIIRYSDRIKELKDELKGNISETERKAKQEQIDDLTNSIKKRQAKQNEDVDKYLDRDKSKDKLNYNENTKDDTLYGGTFRKKEDTSTKDPYDDPESEESQRLMDIESRYDNYLQETEGRGASYGELAYIQGLRGKDLDDFEKELDDFDEKESKRNKSTNETMNNAIREKASKKKEVEQDLPKHTEIKTQGTSNRKEVSENIQAHILDYYDSPDDFVEQMDVFDYLPNNWKRGEEIAKGGSYLVYNGDMSDFLDSLKINPKGKKFSEDKAFDMYVSLVGRESAKLYDRIKRNQFNQYKKDHPLTKMTFEDFKDMKK